MPWSLWSSPRPGPADDEKKASSSSSSSNSSSCWIRPDYLPTPAPKPKQPVDWTTSLNGIDWQQFSQPRNWVPSALAVTAILGVYAFWRSYLRRLPSTGHIAPGLYRRRSLLGQVTSVGDGDNFRLFHTPGGRLAGWGWLRKVPTDRKELKDRTVRIFLSFLFFFFSLFSISPPSLQPAHLPPPSHP